MPHSGRTHRRLLAATALLLFHLALEVQGDTTAPVEDWQAIVRDTPYWDSQGVYNNILDIRRWVLEESGYCADPERHLLFDHRGRFIGYISNGPTSAETQQRLNQQRQKLAQQGRATGWTPGDATTTGYPFALACDQPHARLDEARERYLGESPSARLWGRWDDLDFAAPDQPGNLHEALLYVYNTRSKQRRQALPAELPRYLAGMLMIESGGRTRAHSTANAKGVMQLTPRVLADCGVAPRNHWHRLAQLDCAMKLMSQNARILEPAINQHFARLPEAKRQRLFTLLLIQAYHGGATRVNRLMEDEELNGPARYFAENHERFSAGDIAFGMIFHNLGRDRLGLASLYYVADVELATQALCQQHALRKTPFCQSCPIPEDVLPSFLPPGLSPDIALLLMGFSVFTSMVTAALGAGGGVMLLALMAMWVPPAAVIPVHGIIQLGSNAGRMTLTWRHIDWGVIAAFAPGVVLGALAGSVLLVSLPPWAWQVTIALFVLYLCWGPKLPLLALGRWGIMVASALTSFISLFVGATGPLVAAFIKQIHQERFPTVATFATAMTLQHLPKALVFGLAGFVFQDWIGFLAAMIVCGFAGTWLGLRLLNRLGNRAFRTAFNGLLTLLAIRLLWLAWLQWAG